MGDYCGGHCGREVWHSCPGLGLLADFISQVCSNALIDERKTLDTNHNASTSGFYWNGTPINYEITSLLNFLSCFNLNSFFQGGIESDHC